ncbi:DNA methyltransferase [Spongiactinospora rosea]|nr:DNA methyltransferase [Spongiactinospora rosea]
MGLGDRHGSPLMSRSEGLRPKDARANEYRLLPLSVWLCSETTPVGAAKDRPHAGEAAGAVCGRHRQAVGRELARHLIGACSRPGGVVVDVFATSETVLVAAAEAGRLGVGCVPRPAVAQYLATRLREQVSAGRRAAVRLRPHGADRLREALDGLEGRVELLIAALPPYPGPARGFTGVLCPSCRAEPALGVAQLGRFLENARQVLAPSGHLAVITSARYERGRVVDLAPEIIRHAGRAGLAYVQHVIALRAPIDGDSLVVQADPRGLAQIRRARSGGLPPVVSVHADVCLFTPAAGAAW